MSNVHKYRSVVFYKSYFQNFFATQNPKVKSKIIWTLELIEELEVIPETYLKHIQNAPGLYEIRVQFGVIFLGFFTFLKAEN